MNAMRMTASTGIFFISPIASMATTWPTDTWGSKNWASLAAITMSASATQWNPPPQQIPLIAVTTGFHTPWCHEVKWTSNSSIDWR